MTRWNLKKSLAIALTAAITLQGTAYTAAADDSYAVEEASADGIDALDQYSDEEASSAEELPAELYAVPDMEEEGTQEEAEGPNEDASYEAPLEAEEETVEEAEELAEYSEEIVGEDAETGDPNEPLMTDDEEMEPLSGDDAQPYTVILDANGGYFRTKDEQGNPKTVMTYQVTYDDILEDIEYDADGVRSADPVKELKGWSKDRAGTKIVRSVYEAAKEACTLYAVFEDAYKRGPVLKMGRNTVIVDTDSSGTMMFFTPSETGPYRIYSDPGAVRILAGNGLRTSLSMYEGGDYFSATYLNTTNGQFARIANLKAGVTYGLIVGFGGYGISGNRTEICLVIEKGREVTVTFDACGGTFKDGSTTARRTRSERARYYEFFDDVGEPSMPTAAHKFFMGWSGEKDGALKDSFGEVIEDETLYAVWKNGNKITLDLNGGTALDENTDARVSTFSYYCKPGEDADYNAYDDGPGSLHDYRYADGSKKFAGWGTSPDSKKAKSLKNLKPEGDTTYYALWKDCYKVTLDANGGEFYSGNETIEGDVLRGATAASLKIDSDDLSHPDSSLKLAGWSADKNASWGVDLKKLKPTADNVVYYAVWQPKRVVRFHVTEGAAFDPEAFYSGAVSEDLSVYTYTGDSGGSLNSFYITSDDFKTIPSGKGFVGWALSEGGDVLSGDYKIMGDTDFYSVWADSTEITYQYNQPLYPHPSWDSKTGEYRFFDVCEEFEGSRLYPYILSSFDKEGTHYHFLGWSRTKDGKEPVDLTDYTVVGPETFYAVWEKTYRVFYNGNGGTVEGMRVFSEIDTEGASLAENADLKAFSDDEHLVFDYWSTDIDGREKVDLGSYIVSGEVNFYANWRTLHFITLDANGGFFSTPEEKAFKTVAEDGKKLSYLPSDIPQVAAEGTEFKTWALDPAGMNPVGDSLEAYVPEGDAVLYAIYSNDAGQDETPTPEPDPEPTAPEGMMYVDLKVQFGQGEARDMLDLINSFRQGPDAWAWNQSDTEMEQYAGLQKLVYDYDLERTAMLRAAEIALKFAHERPNGQRYFSAGGWNTSENYYGLACGENIAYGYSTARDVFTGWREDNNKYGGQGHRRNMLGRKFQSVGIGHVILNGVHYWVQEFGTRTGSAATDARNTEAKQQVMIPKEQFERYIIPGTETGLTLECGASAAMPGTDVYIKLKNGQYPAWGTLSWSASDESVAKIEGGRITATGIGETELRAKYKAETFAYKIKVVPPDFAKAQVILPYLEQAYTGRAFTPKVQVILGGKTLTEGSDYTVSYADNINVGTAVVTVSGKGSYTGKKTASFAIKASQGTKETGKKAQPMTVKAKSPSVKAGSAAKKKQTIKKAKAFTIKNAKGAVSFRKVGGSKKLMISDKGVITVKKGTKKGTYKIKVVVTAAGGTGYKAGAKTVTVKVQVK